MELYPHENAMKIFALGNGRYYISMILKESLNTPDTIDININEKQLKHLINDLLKMYAKQIINLKMSR